MNGTEKPCCGLLGLRPLAWRLLSASASIALAASAASASASPSDDTQAIKAVICHHLDSVNLADPLAVTKHDLAAISADWASEGVIIDTFPPNVWYGRSPARRWWMGVGGRLRSRGNAKVRLSIIGWQRVDIDGDHAYAPADATALMTGPAGSRSSSGTMTFALVRSRGVWRISGWSWGSPPSRPVPVGAP